MITASEILNRVKAHLDDHDSGRYNEADDLIPALNSAVEYLTTVFSAGFERKKIYPEVLTELVRTLILPVVGNGQTRKVDITSVYASLWTIIGVDPNPLVTGSPTLDESRNRWATRLTLEEWNDKAEDPFAAGSLVSIPDMFARAAYTGPGNYFGAYQHIMIRPGAMFDVASPVIALWYLSKPSKVTTNASTIEFSVSMTNWLVMKTLNYISLQHGPESKFGPVTEKELMSLISLINA